MMGTPFEPASVAKQLYAAYNGKHVDVVGRLYADSATHQDIAHGRPKTGPSEISEGLGKFFGWFPDAQWELESIIAGDGDKVAVSYTLTATLQTAMGPISPRGQRISLRGVQVLEVKNGKIQRSEDYWDATTFQKQLNSNGPEERS